MGEKSHLNKIQPDSGILCSYCFFYNHVQIMSDGSALDSIRQQDLFAEVDETTLIRTAIRRNRKLPPQLARATISYRVTRIMTRALLQELCASHTVPLNEDHPSDRLLSRRRHLRRFLGKQLLCAVIPQPGVLYTVEIDPNQGELVHWEWLPLTSPR